MIKRYVLKRYKDKKASIESEQYNDLKLKYADKKAIHIIRNIDIFAIIIFVAKWSCMQKFKGRSYENIQITITHSVTNDMDIIQAIMHLI